MLFPSLNAGYSRYWQLPDEENLQRSAKSGHDVHAYAETTARLQYARPTLTTFGPVGVLTQGGSGMMTEMVNMMGDGCSMGVNRSPCTPPLL